MRTTRMKRKKDWVARTVATLDALERDVREQVIALRDVPEGRAEQNRLRALQRVIQTDRALVRCTLLDKRNRAATMQQRRISDARIRAIKNWLRLCGIEYDDYGWREQVYDLEPRLKDVGF